MSIFTAEAIGTAILILLGDGVVAGVLLNRSKSQNGGWIVITFGWGLGVAMAIFAVGGFSGAHINPAVTIAFAATGVRGCAGGAVCAWSDVPLYLAGEFVGAFIGATLVWLAYLPHWADTEDPGLKLAVFSTGPAIRNTAANIICEVIGTAMLVIGVLGIIQEVNQPTVDSGLVPLLVGLLVVSIGLSLGGPTGYAINPARDLGPRIAHAVLPIAGKGSSDWEYAWIPVVGPIVGGIVGAVFFNAVWP